MQSKYPKRSPSETVSRMGELLASGHGTQKDAQVYFSAFTKQEVRRFQLIVAKAEEQRSWEFMEGCYTQAMTLYVLASVLYEKHPAHVIMSDSAYDDLARWLLKNFKKLNKEFREGYCITSAGLRAGTGMGVQGDPNIRHMVQHITGIDDNAS
jgi:hypothetical protein